ncbi:hypothetical protein [Actinomadura nitritigenes]|uniref:hypothetical protein n=1 Tax=Actinomadura nitritigenes TaxID=134602 RepID=UPI003D9334C4
MKNEFMPEELHAATAHLVTETVDRLQEVLRYSHAPTEWEWPRMVLYRITDAQDTLGMLVGLHAAHALHAGCDPDLVRRYMQTSQQCSRAEMPRQQDVDYLYGLMGWPTADPKATRYITGKIQRAHRGDGDRHEEWTMACVHALQAFACAEPGELEPGELDDLPASISTKAKRVYATLGQQGSEPEPADT